MFCSSVLDDLYKNIHEHKNFWLQDHKLRIDFMEAGLSPDTPLPLDLDLVKIWISYIFGFI